MSIYLLLASAGCVLSLALTPIVSRVASALGLLDAPGGRKVHPASVPRTGGVAVGVAASAALVSVSLALLGLAESASRLAEVVPIVAGGAIVFAAGLVDDVRPIAVAPRLAAQTAGALVVMASGLLIERVTIAGTSWPLGVLAWPLTLVWIVGVTNAFNLIDGVDGLAAGITVISGATCAVILVLRGHEADAMLLAALVGAALGFLAFNFAPASIFLGDGGSLLIGFVLATTAITGWQKGATALAAGVPLLLFALPILDTASAVVRRAVRQPDGRPRLRALLARLVEPDRAHIHHRLLGLGWSTRRTVLTLYAVTVVLCAMALATADLD
ncbi:MAG: MraY family glycosyltransferase [Acidobacteriota bacterium]